jgi:pyruvate dehydrogenase (quinone)
MKITVADQVVQMMISAGIQRVYGLVGDSLNPLTDAIRRSNGKLRWIHCRHEEVAAFAAGADSMVSGQPTACAGSCGPGNLHLINGLYNAHRNGASVFAIAGQVPTEFLGTDFFQETHPERIFKECTRYCEAAYTPIQAVRISKLAIQSAITKRGVGMAVLPGDVLAQPAPLDPSFSSSFFTHAPRMRPTDADLEKLSQSINAAERPVIFGGEGCRGAREQVLALAKKLNAPIGFAYRGKDVLEADNPNCVGMTGLLGWGALQQAFSECDTLIMLGTDFPYAGFLPEHARVLQIDSDPLHLGRRISVEMGLCGDVAETLDGLLPLVRARGEDRLFLDHILHAHRIAVEHLQSYVQHGGSDGKLRPEQIGDAVHRAAAADAIFTVDTGMNCVWAARYLHVKREQRIVLSFNHGTMANAMPDSIGAQVAFPDRQVIAFCGDGGLSMLLGDLLTIVAERLPIKIILFNNSSLGMVRAEMMMAGYPFWGTEVHNPDFSAIAKAIGLYGERVEKTADMGPAIKRAFEHNGPALLDFTTDPNALAAPPKVTFKEIQGFALAMTRLVFDHRGQEAVDLAENNIRDLPAVL